MSLQEELNFPNPVLNPRHETIISLVLTGALLTKEGDRLLNPYGLTDSQFNVLMLLRYQTEDGQLNQTQLGRMLLVNRSNVTGLIDRMEKAGWVQRISKSGDRRVNQIKLTSAGRRLVERAEKAYFTRIEHVLANVGEIEQNALKDALSRIRQSIHVEP